MSSHITSEVPPGYDASLTARRQDLRSLRACWWEFVHHFSPQAVIATVALTVAARILVGNWSWRDAVLPAAVLAAQPFVEWAIHRYLLHMPALRLGALQVELYGAVQHRCHHRRPSDLARVLLKPIEVTSFLVAIAAVSAALMWAGAALSGGEFLPLWLSYTGLCYLGLLRYESSHFLIHTPYVPRSSWYRRIWRNHRLHHFKHEDYWLGVSSNFGDRVLHTDPDQRTITRSATARSLGAPGPA